MKNLSGIQVKIYTLTVAEVKWEKKNVLGQMSEVK